MWLRRGGEALVSIDIVLYLFFAGMGASAFLIGCAVDLAMRRNPSRRLGRMSLVTDAGMFVGPPVTAASALFLIADLGVPERFFMAFFSPSSLLTWGAWGLALFVLFAVFSLLLSPFASFAVGRVAEASCQAVAVVCALFTLLYSAFFLSAYPSVPLLRSPLVPLLFALSSLSAGLALLFLIAFARGRITGMLGEMRPLVHFEAVVVVSEMLATIAFLVYAALSGGGSADSLFGLIFGDLSAVFWIGAVLVGMVLPFALDVLNARKVNMWLVGAGSLCVVVGAFCLRYSLLASSVRYSLPFMIAAQFWL